jgi:nicotinamide-nucleotide amidase
MKAIILNIGDELLIGQVTNFNASWMAEQLNIIGIDVIRINVIADREDEIIFALNEAMKSADLILLTGGLGPTKDDITKNTLCNYFNTELVFDENTYKNIEDLFTSRGFAMTETNRKQAEVPANCKVILNTEGTAPGMWFEKDNRIIVSTPGVPFELKAMMSNFILPEIESRAGDETIVHRTVLTQGVGESFLADMISDWENQLPSFIRLAYLPSPGLVRLRLTARGTDKNVLTNEIEKQIENLKKIIGEYIFGYDTETMEQIIGGLLIAQKKTLVTAESCTGGAIAQRITSVAGSSAYYKGSVIAYSNEVKENILNVKPDTLAGHGAVSEETVREMAYNVRLKLNADYSLAVSGIAGPDGGTPEKPVGLVWIAVSSVNNTIAKKFQFGNNRLVNIDRAVVTALNMLRKAILQAEK